jgi:hypothetical protein
MSETPKPTGTANPRFHTAQWIVAVLLAFVAGMLWARPPAGTLPTALAQNPPLVGARGIYAFTGQLDHNQFGLFMLDIEQGTIWCYEVDNVSGVRKLRLVAARSWVYDRYLRDFNCAPPDFRAVQELVAQQRATPPAATERGGGETGESQPSADEDRSERR